jgi:hypothetical protein
MKTRGGITGYFQYVTGILALSTIIKSKDIHTEKRTPTEGFLRGDVLFKVGSRLHFRELVSTEDGPEWRVLGRQTVSVITKAGVRLYKSGEQVFLRHG